MEQRYCGEASPQA